MHLLVALCTSLALAGTPAPSVNAGEPALAFGLQALNEDVAMKTVDRVRVSLSDFTGVKAPFPRKAVVVHFFDGRPSDELEVLDRVAKRFDNKGVQVVAIVRDSGSVGDLADWVLGLDLEYPVLRDIYGVVSTRYGVQDPPLTFIVDGDGAVFAIGQPSVAEMEDELGRELVVLTGK